MWVKLSKCNKDNLICECVWVRVWKIRNITWQQHTHACAMPILFPLSLLSFSRSTQRHWSTLTYDWWHFYSHLQNKQTHASTQQISKRLNLPQTYIITHNYTYEQRTYPHLRCYASYNVSCSTRPRPHRRRNRLMVLDLIYMLPTGEARDMIGFDERMPTGWVGICCWVILPHYNTLKRARE